MSITLIEKGPHHNIHICKNLQCKAVVRINRLETKEFKGYVVCRSFHADGNVEDTYAGGRVERGYTCPECEQFNNLYLHLGEYTQEDLTKFTPTP